MANRQTGIYDGGYNAIDIPAAFEKYTGDVKKEIRKAIRNNGSNMLNEIVDDSPVRQIVEGRRIPSNVEPGKYKRSWKKTVKNTSDSTRIIVHNEEYRLPHLQELKHKTGKEGGHRGAYPGNGQTEVIGSIRAANKKYSDKLNEEIQKILEK